MSRPYQKKAIKKQAIAAAQAGLDKPPSSRLLRNRLKRTGKGPDAIGSTTCSDGLVDNKVTKIKPYCGLCL